MIVALALLSLAADEPGQASVVEERALVYEQPDLGSNVVRRLYPAEIVRVDGQLTTDDGRRWLRVRLGPEMLGYVEASRTIPTSELPQVRWRPSRVVRDERPLGIATRIGGETFGGGLNLRYLAFSRLGLSFTVGSVVDGEAMRGTSLSGGLVSYIVLWNLSPMLEAGWSRVSYHAAPAILRVNLFYVTSGLEWMFDFGFFANVAVTYYRSIDAEVAFDYGEARAERFTMPEKFGALEIGEDGTLQGLKLGGALGYAF
jgi:hypothetical protein